MGSTHPLPNPATVEALLDTTWRIAAAETSRTDALDRKAASLATFASVVLSLTAALGPRFSDRLPDVWLRAPAFAVYLIGLGALVAAVAVALRVLRPKEYLTLGMAYLERFPKWLRS